MKRSRGTKKQLSLLKDWLNKRGWQLYFSHRCVDAADFDVKTVFCRRKKSVRNALFTILHECGHVLNGVKVIEQIVYADKHYKGTKAWRIGVVTQEMKAWDAGERLANRLGISVDPREYAQYKAKFLMSYFSWAHLGKKHRKKSVYCD